MQFTNEELKEILDSNFQLDVNELWIPCPFPYKTEDMPLEGEYVLCTTETKKGTRQVVRGYAGQDVNGIWHWHCGMNSNILAWMPLPEPWKGEG